MSNIGSYTSRSFSENQKFLVLDPSTGTTSLVLGSDLVSYITPQLSAVNAESTRLAAENTDYAVGEIIQTSGSATPGDNFAAVYLVVEGGAGDFPMINGNDLLTIRGDEFLREQLIQNTAGDGSDLILHTGTDDTVTEALDKRTIYVSLVSELSSIVAASGFQALVSGVPFIYDGATWSPSEGYVTPFCFGAVGDGVVDDTSAVQSAIDYGASAVLFPGGFTYLVSSLNLISNQRLYTNGDQAILDGGPSRTADIFLPLGASGVEIDGLEFTRFDRTISHTADVDETPINDVTINNCYFHDCNQGIFIVWYAKNVWVKNNRFKDITFNGATSAIQIGRQENTRFPDLFTQSSYYILSNTIETVTNTDTVAADTHGVIARGYNIVVDGNTIRDVSFGAASGTGCEGIYIVGWYSKIVNNSLYNAGNREASIVLKGGFDDGIIPTGAFGYNNVVANNNLYYYNAVESDASAFYSNADDTLFIGNVVEGFGDSAFKLTSNGNRNHVINNYIVRFTGGVVVNATDSVCHAVGNIIERPASSSTSFYCFFVRSFAEDIVDVFIKDNHITIDDNLTSVVFYVTYLAAEINDISNAYSDNRLITTNTTTTKRVNGTVVDSSMDTVFFGGQVIGDVDELVRFVSGGIPKNLTIDIYTGSTHRSVLDGSSVTRGESGKTITNAGAVGTATASLPASLPNYQFTFIRTESQIFRVDPSGTEVIRGGGAGKFLELGSDGSSVTLKCVETGTWEIISSNGTITYEP